jgi:hypothetical protein
MTLDKSQIARRQLGVALALFLEDLDLLSFMFLLAMR